MTGLESLRLDCETTSPVGVPLVEGWSDDQQFVHGQLAAASWDGLHPPPPLPRKLDWLDLVPDRSPGWFDCRRSRTTWFLILWYLTLLGIGPPRRHVVGGPDP